MRISVTGRGFFRHAAQYYGRDRENPAATFYARVSGNSMINDGIGDGDILVVDKSVDPYDGCIAICYLDGEFTSSAWRKMKECIMLVPGIKNLNPFRLTTRITLSSGAWSAM